METKPLDVTSSEDLKAKVSDVKTFGNPDAWVLICKASSEEQGWMKSTKALQTPVGTFVQVTTQQRNIDLTWSIAEAVAFAPGLTIADMK